ncbi:putative F-box protein At4g22170 [Telopea speciosissima]|uniref:putative F-box protein At4g22170 n=1 Tax=Telopea speciosissima TaxID=54955 RepID=UPI001CC7213B|nr:putative F-box protein At4g22170 [Telopea speciosissima]
METKSAASLPDGDAETKKNENEMYRPWSNLPDLLIHMIYDRLDLKEKIRFASVCVNWGSAAPKFPIGSPQKLIPWLLFPHDSLTETVSFFNLPENMIYHVRIPKVNMHLCRGSSEGWLFLFADVRDDQCFLLNPFTKNLIRLPPLGTKPRRSVLKMILSSNPDTSEDWKVIVQLTSSGLLFCESGDMSWSIGLPQNRSDFDYENIIFCDGKVYGYGLSTPSLWVFDLKTQQQTFKSCRKPNHLSHNLISYLVESNGEIFLVARFLKNCDQSEEAANYHYRTFKFELYKLMKENDGYGYENGRVRQYEYGWVRQSNLGADQALFLSKTGSKFVSTIENPRVHSNSIYFTNDLHPRTAKVCDTGVCHVEDGQIEPFLPFNSISVKFPSAWLVCDVEETSDEFLSELDQ